MKPLRKGVNLIRNFVALNFGKGLVPPERMVFTGCGNYEAIGREFFEYFKDYGRITPSDSVLEVGCGMGRMAIPLTEYLNKDASYEGFDIVPLGIKWGTRKFTSRFNNFHFQVADVYNKTYNPKGKYKASEYRFPYKDDEFDFVYLTSVFTHMYPVDVENYLSQISRVLKKGKRCLITFFLLNEESLSHVEAQKSSVDLRFVLDEFSRTISQKRPEGAIAIDEGFVRDIYEKNGLAIENVLYGSWCGRGKYTSYQDMVVASKS